MMDLFQWAGFAAIVIGYWYLKKPEFSAACTLFGCMSILIWALLISPIAWGVVALEVAVGIIAIRNLAS